MNHDIQIPPAFPISTGPSPADGSANDYRQVVRRVNEAIRLTAGEGSKVLVVSKGDPELLRAEGRHVSHFPQEGGGANLLGGAIWAGYHPADGAAAVAHLRQMIERGAEYLVFPSTALWWLDHYLDLRLCLEREHELVFQERDACFIYALGGTSLPLADELKTGAKGVETAKRRPSRDSGTCHHGESGEMARTIRDIVRCLLPAYAVVAVLSQGDNELLKLDVRRAVEFPEDGGGILDALPEAVGAEASRQLEEFRLKGGEYLVVPRRAFWWLKQYESFRRHLEQNHRPVIRQAHFCQIFQLQPQGDR